jgi:uncharacterized protein YndB with AHSA1/START domain
MNAVAKDILVRKSIVVNTPQEHAFRTFTDHVHTWWPVGHHIGGKEPYQVIIEPKTGGRWFERADDGSECNWGRVLAWEPPQRVLLSWDINADWKYQPGLGSEVEVVFHREGPEKTRVVLEHRKLEVFGEKAEQIRQMMEGEGAWGDMLVLFAKAAEGSRR